MALLAPKRIRRGNAVAIGYVIRSTRSYPPGELVDPDGGVRVTIFQPNGVLVLGPVDMTKVTNHPDFPKGLYEYLYQTTSGSMLGTWLAECEETHLAATSVSRRESAFILED